MFFLDFRERNRKNGHILFDFSYKRNVFSLRERDEFFYYLYISLIVFR